MRSLIICTPLQIGIIRMIKSRVIRWLGHVARKREKRNVYKILAGNQKNRDH
jgi:hypothetical protein